MKSIKKEFIVNLLKGDFKKAMNEKLIKKYKRAIKKLNKAWDLVTEAEELTESYIISEVAEKIDEGIDALQNSGINGGQ